MRKFKSHHRSQARGIFSLGYYDHSKNIVVDDTREYFRRIGQENHYYAGAFQIFFNPYIESFLYLPSKKLPIMELEQLKSSIISDSSSEFTSVLIASVDAISHTQGDSEYLMVAFDQFVTDLIEEHKNLGIDAEIVMVSDHGQDFDFKLGEPAKELKIAYVQDAVAEAGFNIKRSLKESNDIAMPLMALGNYISIFFKDLSKRESLIGKLQSQQWFEQAIIVKKRDERNVTVNIYNQEGYAQLKVSKESDVYKYHYSTKTSNALEVDSQYQNKILKK